MRATKIRTSWSCIGILLSFFARIKADFGFVLPVFMPVMAFRFGLCFLAALFASSAYAHWLDDMRKTDLNNYALGLAVANAENPYAGASDSAYLYPYLTSFEDSALNDNWLLVRDSNVGLRVVKGDWEVGLLGRINTLGTGDGDSAALTGLRERRWNLELAPMIGYRGWPVHVNFKTYAEVSGRHSGLSSLLTLSLPIEMARGYLVPGLELVYQDDDYLDYYYGVSAGESNLTRPAYSPDSGVSTMGSCVGVMRSTRNGF
jgi:outer membrane scaffolding protein for murein synthesis (MipA/OmpV family)